MKKSRQHIIINAFKSLIRFLKKHNTLFQIFVNFAMLIISIVAIIIAVKSYNSANQQSKDNSIKSDNIFKIQLANEKKINTNLEKIQELANNQIKITHQQLDISSKMLNDQINSKRPILSGFKDTLTDQYNIFNGQFAPIIHTLYVNVGNRYAYNVNFRAFVISNDFALKSSNIFFNTAQDDVGPEVIGEWQYKPKIDLDSYQSGYVCFYYCYEISYYDKLTLNYQQFTTYKEYTNDRGKFIFHGCNSEIKERLKQIINKELKLDKKPEFKE